MGLWPVVGCDGGTEDVLTSETGEAGDPAVSGDGDGTTNPSDQASGDTPATNDGTGTVALPECSASADAVLTTDMGELTYEAATVSATSMHSLDSGCIYEMSINVSQGDGCALSLTLQTLDGDWALSGGSLTVDEGCGSALAEAAAGTYLLDAGASTGGLDGQPTVASANEAGCHPATGFDFTGVAHFKDGDAVLSVNLNGLMLSGDVLSTVGTGTACPAEIPACTDRTCGTDTFGKSCGDCAEGEACVDGGCRVWNCPPGAPFGTHPGENLTDVELRDCDGNTVYLHELCGADAAYFNLLAGW
jgi:hypothetical protein